MKLMNKKAFWILTMLAGGFVYLVGCTHKDESIVTSSTITRGNHVHLPGTLTAGNPDQWKLDKTHSSVLWQSAYVGAAGLLTGRFNQFGMANVTPALGINYYAKNQVGQPIPDTSWAFYESDPTKTYFYGYVQINTSNTGEPGRDTGCNIAGMGTIKIIKDTMNLSAQNCAKIKSTKVEYDPASAGYIVTLDLTYQGKLAAPLTKSITGKLKYVSQQKVQFGTAAAYDVFGLQLTFQFNCRDYGINSTSIADIIEITCNMNYNNK